MASRQYVWQQSQFAKGLCGICAKPVVRPGSHVCVVHLEANRLRERKRLGCGPWKPGMPGRRPLT